MDVHERHKRHRNILYMLVIILFIGQVVFFLVLSAEFTKLNFEIIDTRTNLSGYFTNLLDEYKEENQQNLNEITKAIAAQQAQQQEFQQEIKLLKSSQADFSGIIEDAVKGVVGIVTDRATGTGFFVNVNGYIVTNFHVVYRAEEINVLTYDKQVFQAKLIVRDSFRDLALLKIDGVYQPLRLENSENLQLGDKVIAIGNPLGLSFSVTEGIISGLDRPGPNSLKEYIQTDVSLNPGNSGGPLINTAGNVVGINNFKIGGAENIGFALESNSIRDTINELMKQEIIH